jgi:hypothetical protein
MHHCNNKNVNSNLYRFRRDFDDPFTDYFPRSWRSWVLVDHALGYAIVFARVPISFRVLVRASLLELLSKVLSLFGSESLARVGATLAFHGAATFTNGISEGVMETLVTPPGVCQVLEICVRCAATEEKDLDQCLYK